MFVYKITSTKKTLINMGTAKFAESIALKFFYRPGLSSLSDTRQYYVLIQPLHLTDGRVIPVCSDIMIV